MMTTLSGLCTFLFLLGVLSSHISHASVHVSPYPIAHLSLPSVKWEDLTSVPPPLCSLLYLLSVIRGLEHPLANVYLFDWLLAPSPTRIEALFVHCCLPNDYNRTWHGTDAQ